MDTRVPALPEALDNSLRAIGERISNGVLGVSVYDSATSDAWSFNGDRWFHAASVMKIAVLLAPFDAVDQGRFRLNSRLHVRNRFLSAADGQPFVSIPREMPRAAFTRPSDARCG